MQCFFRIIPLKVQACGILLFEGKHPGQHFQAIFSRIPAFPEAELPCDETAPDAARAARKNIS
jgi:hypothetical protein